MTSWRISSFLRAQALTDRGDLLLLEPPTRPDGARKLADAAAKASGGLAAVFAGAESSYVYALVQADGADISPLVKRLNAALSGRGGGRNGFAQGSVQADRTAIYDFFRKEGIECPTC
ncbi:MAG: DHH family phosphoesterase [Dysosmobacter welbionis]